MRVRVLPFERLLLANDMLAVGSHRLPVDHPEFESYGPASSFLIVFPRNSTLIEHAEGERFVGSPAIAALYNRGQEYRRWSIGGEGDDCDWFAINPDALREIVARYDPPAAESDRPLRFSHVRVDSRIYLQQRAVVDQLSTTFRADALFVEETMLSVFTRLLARAYEARPNRLPPRVSKRQEALVRATGVLLSRSFARNTSLSQLAREVGSSPYHLARSFKLVTGATIHAHRLALRLHASLAMLRDGSRVMNDDAGISSIAIALGFSDHSHFTAAFRQQFGVTPSRYRDRARFS